MSRDDSLDRLLGEARSHPVEGWDFGWLEECGRLEEEPLPWDYDQLVRARIRGSPDLLDLGTGGGERLARYAPFPPRAVATESYAPNVRVAARRLSNLGVQVVATSSAADNSVQRDADRRGRLPFRNGSFHLVVDRNEAFRASEVARVLSPGGLFLTEQSGSAEIEELGNLLGMPAPGSRDLEWDLPLARKQLTDAGLRIVDGAEARSTMTFHDVGALVWYLRAVPWVVPGFSIARGRKRLEALHDRFARGIPLEIARYGFRVEARR